ncbi:MAG: GtrA family protein [Oscillospiraceae bacterium]|nr:GtrA family protein [Oscillospiraceae bacterium]
MKKLIRALWQILERVLTAVLRGIFRLFGKELSEQTRRQIMQFVKFGMVGVMNTAISLIVYYAVILFRRDWYLIGSIAGFFVSVLNAYYWNSRFVFRKQDDRLRTLLRTYLAYGTNLLLGTVLLWLLVERLGISPFLAPFINLIITIPLNFVLNKFWVMKKQPQKEEKTH